MLQPVIHMIYGNDPLRSLQPGEFLRQQPHRPAAENDNRIAVLHSGIDHTPIGGWHDVGQKQQLFIRQLGILRHLEGDEIGKGDPNIFRLSARISAVGVAVPEITSGIPMQKRIAVVALALQLVGAVPALSAGYIKGDNHPVAFFDGGHLGPRLLHNAHGLVADNKILGCIGDFPVKHVEI
ncbi:hypothetical protein D3C76_1370060 [compost metagenome]